MSDFVVAFHVPHNEGVVAGLITGSGFDSSSMLVDLYEVDASVASFGDENSALLWLDAQGQEAISERMEPVTGGLLYTESDEY